MQIGCWNLRENSGFKGELQSGFRNLRENLGFKGGVAEWLLEFEREFRFQRGSCRVGFGILRERIRASVGSCRVAFEFSKRIWASKWELQNICSAFFVA